MERFGGRLVMAVGICVLLFFVIEKSLQINLITNQAIQRGYALYCPLDGKLAWVGECDNDGEE